MYLDTLVRINNASQRKYERIKIPFSKMDLAILESMVKCGYLESAVKKGRGVKRIIEIKLKYNNGEPAISETKVFSRSSRRMYFGYKDIKKSHQGYGKYFFSTPKGILTGEEARKNKVGGEILFEIW